MMRWAELKTEELLLKIIEERVRGDTLLKISNRYGIPQVVLSKWCKPHKKEIEGLRYRIFEECFAGHEKELT